MTKVKALLMAIVLASLGFFIYQTERREFLEKAALEKTEELILPDIKEEQFQQIHVVAPNNSYRLQKTKNNSWVLVKPEGVPANPERVSAIIKTLLRVTAKNVIPANEIEQDQSLYGLVPPAMVLTIDGNFGKRTFSFGKKVVASGRRYVQSQSDQRFFLVDDNVFNLLNTTADEIFDKNPFHIESDKITEFSVLRAGEDYLRFIKDQEKKQWKVSSNKDEYNVDSSLIERKLASLNKLKAKHVLELTGETLALYGLKVPKLSANYIISDDYEQGFLVGEGVSLDALNPENLEEENESNKLSNHLAYYIKVQGADYVYQIPHIFFSDFLLPAYYFQDKKPFSGIKKEEIEKITLKKDKKVKEIFFDTDSILFEKLTAVLIDFSVVSYQVISPEDKKRLGLEDPEFTLEFVLKDSKQTISIKAGNELETQQKNKSNSPRWVELKLINGSTVPAVVNYVTYNGLKMLYP